MIKLCYVYAILEQMTRMFLCNLVSAREKQYCSAIYFWECSVNNMFNQSFTWNFFICINYSIQPKLTRKINDKVGSRLECRNDGCFCLWRHEVLLGGLLCRGRLCYLNEFPVGDSQALSPHCWTQGIREFIDY